MGYGIRIQGAVEWVWGYQGTLVSTSTWRCTSPGARRLDLDAHILRAGNSRSWPGPRVQDIKAILRTTCKRRSGRIEVAWLAYRR